MLSHGRGLRRHIRKRRARGRGRFGFCQSKIEQLGAGCGQHDVAGLEVAVRHPVAMGLVERTGDLGSILQDLRLRQRPLVQQLG